MILYCPEIVINVTTKHRPTTVKNSRAENVIIIKHHYKLKFLHKNLKFFNSLLPICSKISSVHTQHVAVDSIFKTPHSLLTFSSNQTSLKNVLCVLSTIHKFSFDDLSNKLCEPFSIFFWLNGGNFSTCL